MSKMLKLSCPTSDQENARRVFPALLLLLLSLMLCTWQSCIVAAQSGRRRTEPPSPSVPSSTNTATGGESESESKPKGPVKTTDAALVTFVVMEDDNLMANIPFDAREAVIDGFLRRLKGARAVAAESAGKGGRNQARDRAKKEKDAFVVFVQLEEDAANSGQQSMGRADTRTLVIKTFVYTPVSGDLKFTDRVWQRPVRQTATIGGVRVPVPVSRSERYPSELQLQQAAREAADRLMSRFNVMPPPEN